MRLGLALVVVVALLALAPAAQAATDGTYRGRTSQGYKTKAVVKDGRIKSIAVPVRARCRNKRVAWGPTRGLWVDDADEPIEQDADSFSDSGRVRGDSHGERSVTTARLSGKVDGDRLVGRVSMSVRWTAPGYPRRQYCKARVRFSAKLVPPAARAEAAAVKLRGQTSQSFPFAAQFVDGRLDRLHFRWRARCNRDTVFRAYTTWLDGPERVIEQDGKTFSDSGTVRNRKPRRHMTIVRRERIEGTLDGTRAIAGKHVTTVRIRQRGRLVYTCRSSIRFSAKR